MEVKILCNQGISCSPLLRLILHINSVDLITNLVTKVTTDIRQDVTCNTGEELIFGYLC